MSETTGAAPGGANAERSQKRTAVVVIHGIGNQAPMATLRGFVDAVWTASAGEVNGKPPQTWLKRDPTSTNHELRRITTSPDETGRRIDFYEFYWANMIEDTRLSSVIWWLKRVLLRKPSRVPPEVGAPWAFGVVTLLLLAAVLVGALLILLKVFRAETFGAAAIWLAFLVAIGITLWILRHRVLVEVVGDAARYLTAAPQNIDARARIRTAGLGLLKELHSDAVYDRIILACHSLGTVIGYDLINFYWSDVCEHILHPKHGRCPLTPVEEAARELIAAPDAARPGRLEDYRRAQQEYSRRIRDALRGNGSVDVKWKITDFVTIGSPLAHSHFLIVDDREVPKARPGDGERQSWLAGWLDKTLHPTSRWIAQAFLSRLAERSGAACPPLTEAGGLLSYPRSDGQHRSPHHGAVFAAVRWTNIYAPRRHVLWGDVIGGPVAPLFGPGVKDVALTGPIARSFVAHTKYWLEDGDDDQHLVALREAVNLSDLR